MFKTVINSFGKGCVVLGSVTFLIIDHDVLLLQWGFCQTDVLAYLGLKDLTLQNNSQLFLDLSAELAGLPSGDEDSCDVAVWVESVLHHGGEITNHGKTDKWQYLTNKGNDYVGAGGEGVEGDETKARWTV